MYCEKDRVLFVHIPKAAGSTVELLLEPYASEKVKLYKRNPELYDWEDDVEVHVSQRGQVHAKHWTILEHARHWLLDLREVKSFAIVRNPYERMLKIFLFKLQNGEFVPRPDEPGYLESRLKRRGKHISEAVVNNWSHAMFESFLGRKRAIGVMSPRTFLSAWQHCSIGDVFAVNHIIKYENLNVELPEVFEKVGLPRPEEIPVTNSTLPLTEEQLRSFYNDKTRSIVESLWRNDFEPFGYELWK